MRAIIAAILSFFLTGVNSYYLPGVSPRSYQQYEAVRSSELLQ